MSDDVTDWIVVDAPVDDVMDVIVDVEAYPQWQSEFRDVQVLSVDADGWPQRAAFTVDAGVLTASYELAYTYGPTTVAWELVDSAQLDRLDGRYELSADAAGTTATYHLTIVPSAPMPSFVRRKAASRIVDGALRALKDRVEGG